MDKIIYGKLLSEKAKNTSAKAKPGAAVRYAFKAQKGTDAPTEPVRSQRPIIQSTGTEGLFEGGRLHKFFRVQNVIPFIQIFDRRVVDVVI